MDLVILAHNGGGKDNVSWYPSVRIGYSSSCTIPKETSLTQDVLYFQADSITLWKAIKCDWKKSTGLNKLKIRLKTL